MQPRVRQSAPSATSYGAPVARSRAQSRTWESAVQYSQRVPGADRGPTRASSARDSPPPGPKQATSRLAGLDGSRWSSTQSTPLVMVSTSRTVHGS